MSYSTTDYLGVFKDQIQNSMVPRDDNARKVPLYTHRILSVMQARANVLPGLQQKALAEIDDLLNELCAALEATDAGLVLVPLLMRHVRTRPDYAEAEPLLQTAVRLLAEKPGAPDRQLQRKIAAITCRVVAALHQAVVDQDFRQIADAKPIESLDGPKKLALRDFLRRKFPSDAALDIGSTRTIIGGGSKTTVMVELLGTRELPGTVVLRIDLARGVVGSTVADEFHLIELVHEAGLPVPKPYLLETDTSVLGNPFIVVSKVEGRNIGDWFEVTEPSRDFAAGLAHALAKLHQIPAERGARLPGADASNEEIVARDIRYFEEFWRASGEVSIVHEQGVAWLKQHMHYATERRAIIHRDAGCHNMLGLDGKLSALLDWETAQLGNPVFDLMYGRFSVEQMMPWEEYLEEYEKAGGTRPSKREEVFFRLLVALFSAHFTIVARKFIEAGVSNGLALGYAAQRVHLHYQRELHDAVRLALESDD